MRRTALSAAKATATAATNTAKQIKTYNLRASATGPKSKARTGSGHLITTDVPVASGGTDSAAEPVYHLLAALVGCETATATFVARKMKINLREMNFELQGARNELGALALPIQEDPEISAALSHIVGICYVDAPGITDSELETLAKQTHLRCPIANMITNSGTHLKIDYERKLGVDSMPDDGFMFPQ